MDRGRADAGPVPASRVTAARERTAVEAGTRPAILSWRPVLICLGGGFLAAGLTAAVLVTYLGQQG